MYIAQLDLKHGAIFLDSEPIEVDENGVLTACIAKRCSPPVHVGHGRTRYHLLRKSSVCGKLADGVIEVETGGALSVTFLFDLIEFFDLSILESKVIKACEQSWNLKLISDHPSSAFLNSCKWGSFVFFHDAKQGDLGLEVRHRRR